MYPLILTIAAKGLLWLWLFLVVIQIVSAGLGTLLGRRLIAEAKQRAEATGLVTGGVLALTAFILALTLSFGTGRMAERRTGALEEANAIGTAWLQASALPDPRAEQRRLGWLPPEGDGAREGVPLRLGRGPLGGFCRKDAHGGSLPPLRFTKSKR